MIDPSSCRRRRIGCGAGALALVVLCGVAAPARASAERRPQAPPAAEPAALSFEEKMTWVLFLEDHRILSSPAPAPAVPVAPPPAAPKGGGRAAPAPVPPAPDLLRLLTDGEARVRRRAALAVGRVGLRAGVVPLSQLLFTDGEPEVRQMAAFALGLIGSRSAVDALRAALADPSPIVRGRAAEALGAVGDTGSAAAIAAMAAPYAADGRLQTLAADDQSPAPAPDVEAYRLGIYALTRLKAWDALLPLVAAPDGSPRSPWWPVAFALSRMEDARAVPALLHLARGGGRLSRAFAARGLGAHKVVSAVPVLLTIGESWPSDPGGSAQAIRALGQIGHPDAAPALRRLVQTRAAPANVRLEAVVALGGLRDRPSLDTMLDLAVDPWPAMRAAALRAAHAIDPESFVTVLSGLDADPDVSVRMALASLLTSVAPDAAIPRLTVMLKDRDPRVVPAVVAALAELKAPGTGTAALGLLAHEDVMVRASAAAALGALQVPGGEAALAAAYRRGAADKSYSARAAALAALRTYGSPAAMPLLREALADPDWAVRVHAAALIGELDPASDPSAAMRPAPPRPMAEYATARLVAPPVSPHVYIETDRGTIEIELFVLDAPQACENFLRLARGGFFTGVAIHRVVPNFVVQDGDPRGDGEGGPGYTMRDEINQQPFLRGTVGMAKEWADTGGSQWFIALSPQPHLDGRYTAFGRVVAGMDGVDLIRQGDVIRQVRTWDGAALHVR